MPRIWPPVALEKARRGKPPADVARETRAYIRKVQRDAKKAGTNAPRGRPVKQGSRSRSKAAELKKAKGAPPTAPAGGRANRPKAPPGKGVDSSHILGDPPLLPWPRLLLAQQEALIERLQRKLLETRAARDVQAKNFKIHEDGWEVKFYSLALLAEELGATQDDVARIFGNACPLQVISDSRRLCALTDRIQEERMNRGNAGRPQKGTERSIRAPEDLPAWYDQ